MITCKFSGRLGNNLFQAAATIALAKKNNTEAVFPACNSQYDYASWLDNRLPRISTAQEHKISTHFHETVKQMFHPVKIYFQQNMCLNGYFQTEKYFEDIREELLKIFALPIPMQHGYVIPSPFTGLIDAAVSIHVRRGDYLGCPDHHPPVTIDYLEKATSYFNERGYYKFIVFSDDIAWCKEALNSLHPANTYHFSQYQSTIADLSLMAHCEHNIIANSTYSWWGAWLNKNPDKIIVCPKTYIGKGNPDLKATHIYPTSWIQIEDEYSKKYAL